MGRPKDTRKEAAKFRMNEKEEDAFIQYFNGWKTNRKLSQEKKLTTGSVKKIGSSVGRYSNKFLARRWINKDKRWFEYEYKRGKKTFKGRQKVPCYKANIKPFIDYFFQEADYPATYINYKVLSTLCLLFELKEVRDYLISTYPSKYYERFGLYEAFCWTINHLIDPWLRLEGRLPHLLGFEDVNAMFVKIPEIRNVQNAILDYFQSDTPDYYRVGERERIIALFDSAWQKFANKKEFKSLLGKAKRGIRDAASDEDAMKIFAYFPSIKLLTGLLGGFPSDKGKKWLYKNTSSVEERISRDLKIRCFADMLYSKDVAEAIMKSFLEPLTQSLIFSRKPVKVSPYPPSSSL